MQIELTNATPDGDYYAVDDYSPDEALHLAEMKGFAYCYTDPNRLRHGRPTSVFVRAEQRNRFRSDFAARFSDAPPATRGMQLRTLKSRDAIAPMPTA